MNNSKAFYLKLALANVKRSREVYLPYFLSITIVSFVYFLILALIYNPGLKNKPGGSTAAMIFLMGIFVFTLLAFGFMLDVNSFLVKRRKREFGLYSVLGMNRRQISRVLMWENLTVMGGGVVAGIAVGMVLGRLLFLLLLSMLHVAPDSTFTLPLVAFLGTFGLFAAIFLVTTIYNAVVIRRANTTDLLHSEQKGERDSKLVVPMTILGALLLAGAYVIAMITNQSASALGLFFPDAIVVMIAIYILFIFGSIGILRVLRRKKQLYYKLDNFISISGMFHRMRQNGKGLATICILSTMLLVTVGGALSLYAGQEDILHAMYPTDIVIKAPKSFSPDLIERFDGMVGERAKQYNLVTSYDPAIIEVSDNDQRLLLDDVAVSDANNVKMYENLLLAEDSILFNISKQGPENDRYAFYDQLQLDYEEIFGEKPRASLSTEEARMESYGAFGGLLFLAAFFAVLFLVETVLIIYFKQITEGYEDRERFVILQKVGMNETQVKKAINRQILWVFFLPLAFALLNILFASNMIMHMLEVFRMYNYQLTAYCIAGVSAVFAVVYLIVYKQTAKVYFRIVKR